MIQAAGIIGTGLATTGLIGAGVIIGVVFGALILGTVILGQILFYAILGFAPTGILPVFSILVVGFTLGKAAIIIGLIVKHLITRTFKVKLIKKSLEEKSKSWNKCQKANEIN